MGTLAFSFCPYHSKEVTGKVEPKEKFGANVTAHQEEPQPTMPASHMGAALPVQLPADRLTKQKMTTQVLEPLPPGARPT